MSNNAQRRSPLKKFKTIQELTARVMRDGIIGPPPKYRPPTKTGRRTGVVTALVLSHAAAKDQFVPNELCPPLTRPQSYENCKAMLKRGYLRQVKKGSRGINGWQPVYQLNRAFFRNNNSNLRTVLIFQLTVAPKKSMLVPER